MSIADHRPRMTGPTYTFKAAGADLWDRRRETPADGQRVRKVQPYGCPRNGIMGQTYVADAETGAFLCMVDTRSLIRAKGGK